MKKSIINKRFQNQNPGLKSTLLDKQVLTSDEWLNDIIIDAVNKMVSTHLGNKNNQSTLLVQTRPWFEAVTCESIIILHDVNHWVTTACIEGEVLYLDSNYVKAQMRQVYVGIVNTEGFLPVTVVTTTDCIGLWCLCSCLCISVDNSWKRWFDAHI